jgi:hypothetical protein
VPTGESRLSKNLNIVVVLWSKQLRQEKKSGSFTCRTHRSAMTELMFVAFDAGAESNSS